MNTELFFSLKNVLSKARCGGACLQPQHSESIRQEDCEVQNSLGGIVRACLKTRNKYKVLSSFIFEKDKV
jgi:hypothetical protein